MFRANKGRSIFRLCSWFSPSNEADSPKFSKLIPRNVSSKGFHSQTSGYYKHISVLAATLGYITYSLYDTQYVVYADKCKDKTTKKSKKKGSYGDNLPIYTMSEVSKHSSVKDRIWVTYRTAVYDVTDFVHPILRHPGGHLIFLAAGGALDPFWMIYDDVHNNEEVQHVLAKYRIGNLDPDEYTDPTKGMPDPYMNEPKRNALMQAVSNKPYVGGSPHNVLIEEFITPGDLFYVRNHHPAPDIDASKHTLEIEIEGKPKTLTLTVEDLKKFPKHTIMVALMCSGNRRTEMTKIKPVQGLLWGANAASNAVWGGARLRDVLEKAGLTEADHDKYKHVQFEPVDAPYGGSIPLWKAVDKRGDVIIAYEMNGGPLPRDHGYPIRIISPGTTGARHVKWLEKIIVCNEESHAHWQRTDYKGFSPNTDFDNVDFTKSPAIQELPVNSAIMQPLPDSTVKVEDGHIIVKGYAWSGGGRDIVRVDVTGDGGKTWHIANFDHHEEKDPPQHYSWTLWSCKIPVSKEDKTVEVWAKAVDSSFNTQSESFENIYNFRGVLNNAYHRIKVNLQ